MLPLPLGEGWGEGIDESTLILTFSQREKGLEAKTGDLRKCLLMIVLRSKT